MADDALPATMDAVQITAPHRFAHVTLPVPQPTPGMVLVRVAATGVCGTDLEIAEGTAPYFRAGRAHYPVVPGHEWSGRVVALGAGATGLAIGQQVVGECSVGCETCDRCRAGAYHICADVTETGILNRDGAFAAYVSLPDRAIHPVPDHVPASTAALTEPTAVALNGVRRTGLKPGEPLSIHGDGPIGLLALLVAQALGAGPVTVVGADTARLALAAHLGARTCNIRQSGARPPLTLRALEATGRPDAVEQALAHLAPGGTLALLGLFGGRSLAALDLDPLVIGDLTLTGVLGSPGLWPETIALIASGRLDPGRIITHRLPLSGFGEALDLARRRAAIKIVIEQPAPT